MLKKINSELLILIIGRILQILIMLVVIRLSTNLLDANEIGNFYLIVSISGFFGLFLVNPVGQYINRKTHEWYEQSKLVNVFYLYNFYILGLSFASIAIVYILSSVGIAENINVLYLSIVVALFVYFNTWNQTIIPMMNMLEHRITFVFFTLASQILYLFLAYLFLSIFVKEGVIWFFGQVVAFGIVAIISIYFFMTRIQNDFSLKNAHGMITSHNIKHILKFTAPLSLGVLFLWMQTQSYAIIIEKYIGSEFLGFFGVGMSVALAITSAFELIIMQYLYPQMYKSMKDENQFTLVISKILNLIIPIYFLLAIFVSIFATYMMTILVDLKYSDSYIYVIFGVWISFFRMSSNILSNVAHAKLKTEKLIYPYSVGGILSVFGVILASHLEYYNYYIPLSLLFASLLACVVMYIKMNKLVVIDIKMKNFYIVILFSIPFILSYYFSEYSNSIIYSVMIVGLFGLYFLYVLFLLIKRGQRID